MARGWESKAVESQVDDRLNEKERRNEPGRTEGENERKRASLQMSRRRIARELEASQSPVHRSALENALQYLDEQLAALDEESH
jgi:hypothetical protein